MQLQVFSVIKNGFTELEDDDFFKDDKEWEKMSIWEQRGIERPDLSQEEIDARVKSIMKSSGSIKLEGNLGLEIAMSDCSSHADSQITLLGF